MTEQIEGIIQEHQTVVGEVNNSGSGFDKYVSNVRLENKILYLDFNDGTMLSVDLSSLSNGSVITGLTEEQKDAINNMIATTNENLILEYDDEVLDVEFSIEDNNLIVTNNVAGLEFSINENGEMEAIY